MAFYLTIFGVLIGGGLLLGYIVRLWALLAAVGLAVFLMYAWEFDAVGVTYAGIAALTAAAAVGAGTVLRRRR